MPLLANDDNLQPGQTYTFTFTLNNWLAMPSAATILADLDSNAPSFLGSVSAAFASGVGLLTNYLNVTFTYIGDGSDVVTDIANELIAAIKAGSNDNFFFTQAIGGTAGLTALSSVSAVANDAGVAVGNAAGAVIGGAASGAATNLGVSGWIVIAVVGLGLLSYMMATTGIGRRALA